MILVDTNVVSELMKQAPSPKVLSWFDLYDAMQLYISSITIAEIRYGIHAMPHGKKRRMLEIAFDNAISEAFKNRVLSFDEDAAHFYGIIMSQCKSLGHPLGILDGQIASIAAVHDLAIATRNTKDFLHCKLELINPFL